MDLHQQLDTAKKRLENIQNKNVQESAQQHLKIADLLVQLAEQHLHDHAHEWENATLAKNFINQILPVIEIGSWSEKLFIDCQRMTESFHEHPRLRMQMLKLQMEIGRQLHLSVNVQHTELKELERNIKWADEGKLDKIRLSEFFKTDPVEWTENWESCIDEVYQKVEQKMSEPDFVMGGSLQYWALKTKVLQTFGIEWKSPAVMNPDLIFD